MHTCVGTALIHTCVGTALMHTCVGTALIHTCVGTALIHTCVGTALMHTLHSSCLRRNLGFRFRVRVPKAHEQGQLFMHIPNPLSKNTHLLSDRFFNLSAGEQGHQSAIVYTQHCRYQHTHGYTFMYECPMQLAHTEIL